MAPPAPHLFDEILEEIFLRLPTPAALARASTACVSFRRIITAHHFLRRFHKLHRPPLLGFVVDQGDFHPAQEPHPSAPLARTLADGGADFSYSFVPKPTGTDDGRLGRWHARDIRDGRVLLEWSCESGNTSSVFKNLAVCDPISGRYVLLPPIPEELTAQQHRRFVEFEPMLAPIGDDEDEPSYRVICTACCKRQLLLFVFSSATTQWRIAASPTWRSLGAPEPSWKRLYRFSYLRGCFYWTSLWCDKSKALVLDAQAMEFSTLDLPAGSLQLPNQQQPHLPQSVLMSASIVGGTRGALVVFTQVINHYDTYSFDVYHATQQNDGESSGEWQHSNVIALSGQCDYIVAGATEGFLFLRRVERVKYNMFRTDVEFFSLDVNTLELKKVCRETYYDPPLRVRAYFGFPPSLSIPSL